MKELEMIERQLRERTELGEVMDTLDKDVLDPETRMTSLDMNTRLNEIEISAMLVIDALTRLGIFPKELGLTRQKKRLAVSLEGKGREEKVRIVAGDRETKQGGIRSFAQMFQRRE